MHNSCDFFSQRTFKSRFLVAKKIFLFCKRAANREILVKRNSLHDKSEVSNLIILVHFSGQKGHEVRICTWSRSAKKCEGFFVEEQCVLLFRALEGRLIPLPCLSPSHSNGQ